MRIHIKTNFQRFVIVGAILVLTSACSVANPFVVVNDSSASISITYRSGALSIKSEAGELIIPPLDTPAVQRTADVRTWKRDWRRVTPDQGALDENQLSCHLTLQPGDSVRIADITNYFGHDHDDLQFHINYLEILGPNGRIVIEGDRVRQQFTEYKGIYEYVYR